MFKCFVKKNCFTVYTVAFSFLQVVPRASYFPLSNSFIPTRRQEHFTEMTEKLLTTSILSSAVINSIISNRKRWNFVDNRQLWFGVVLAERHLLYCMNNYLM